MIKDMTAKGMDTSTIETIAQVTSDQIDSVINATGYGTTTTGIGDVDVGIGGG